MSSPLEVLAPELIYEILSHCDKVSLLIIAQVSHVLNFVAGKEIYENMVIGNRRHVQLVLAASTKHLGWVRNVIFQHHELKSEDFRSLFCLLSTHAPNIRTLRFAVAQASRWDPPTGQVWDDTQALLNTFRSLTLVSRITAKVYNGLPRSASPAGAGRNDLLCHIDDVQVRYGSEGRFFQSPHSEFNEDSETWVHRGTLRTLRLDTIPIPFSSLEEIFDVSNLQRLALWSNYGKSSEETVEVLKRVCTSLEIVSIFQSSLVLHHSPSLLYPYLKTLLLWTSKRASTSFPWTTWLLPVIQNFHSSSPRLKDVHIFVHLPPFNRTNRKENARLKAELQDSSLREFSVELSRLEVYKEFEFSILGVG
ncbi:hypothetical protein DL96DRAFT_903750 [Flagelloscypha sp. PMI_526]|nr:hypothetical protein DL96DRAFT_903750 [Flagelloscypha sp. PMI_526]